MRIGELRKFLDAEEVKHNAEPTNAQYLGKFDDQEIYVPVFKWNRSERYAKDGAFDFVGMGRDLLVYWDVTGLGLFIDHKEAA